MRPARFKPAPLALAAALTVLLSAGFSTQASAQSGAGISAPVVVSIPAQPLGQALNELARQANLQLSFTPGLVAGKAAQAVSGTLTPRQALDRLLNGSGLIAVTEGSVVVVKAAPPLTTSEAVLPAVTVRAGAELLPGELQKPYAGGQVARGARLGVLGDRDLFETPVASKTFTQEFITDQIALNSNDIMLRDSSFTISNAATLNGSTAGKLRGFRDRKSVV